MKSKHTKTKLTTTYYRLRHIITKNNLLGQSYVVVKNTKTFTFSKAIFYFVIHQGDQASSGRQGKKHMRHNSIPRIIEAMCHSVHENNQLYVVSRIIIIQLY